MSGMLTDDEIAELVPSEFLHHQTPIPTQVVSSDEFYPDPQNPRQREVEARLLAMADDLGGKQGMDRRRFFQTAAGMAASFVAMNQVYGPLFAASADEARIPEMAQARADGLKGQFIMDMHTHFLRDDTRLTSFVNMRASVGKSGWNKDLVGRDASVLAEIAGVRVPPATQLVVGETDKDHLFVQHEQMMPFVPFVPAGPRWFHWNGVYFGGHGSASTTLTLPFSY